MYLLDTDTLSNLGKRRPSPALLEHLGSVTEPLYTSAVTVGEMAYGAHRLSVPEAYLQKLNEALQMLSGVLPLDHSAALVWGRVVADLHRKGRPIGHFDSQIAAIALHHDLTIVTGNVSHYQHINGLRLENWL